MRIIVESVVLNIDEPKLGEFFYKNKSTGFLLSKRSLRLTFMNKELLIAWNISIGEDKE